MIPGKGEVEIINKKTGEKFIIRIVAVYLYLVVLPGIIFHRLSNFLMIGCQPDKEMQGVFSWKIVLIVLVTVFGGCVKNDIPGHPHAAGSFIKLGNGLIVVEDVWSGKLSLPGGGQMTNESLEETARRETLEETGILVTVGEELQRTHDFVLFRCEPINTVSAIKLQYSRFKPFSYWIPHSNASRNEIERVLLIDPMLYKEKDFRFPSQLKVVQKLFAGEGKGSENLQVLEKPERRTYKIEDAGIVIIKGFQKFDDEITKTVFHIFTFLGFGGVIFLAVLYFLLCTPWKQGVELLLLLVITSLINGILKDAFGLARPFEIAPSVQWMKASGFGFPSGHAQLATVFWGYFFRRARSNLIKLSLISIILFTGLSRIYLGVHYPHDVIGGWFFGAVILSVYYLFVSRDAVHFFYNGQYSCWVIFFCAAFLSILLRFHPDTVALLALWFGVLCGIIFGGKKIHFIPLPSGFRKKALRVLAGVLGILCILLVFHCITPADRKFLTMFVIQVLKYFCLGLWLSWGSFVTVEAIEK